MFSCSLRIVDEFLVHSILFSTNCLYNEYPNIHNLPFFNPFWVYKNIVSV
jgi:hypothetical protein